MKYEEAVKKLVEIAKSDSADAGLRSAVQILLTEVKELARERNTLVEQWPEGPDNHGVITQHSWGFAYAVHGRGDQKWYPGRLYAVLAAAGLKPRIEDEDESDE